MRTRKKHGREFRMRLFLWGRHQDIVQAAKKIVGE
jgi:hypothetical protein